MNNVKLKTVCSVIEDRWFHYKGNMLYLYDDKIVIEGIYTDTIMLYSIVEYRCKNRFLCFDLYLTIGVLNNKEDLVIRIPNTRKGKRVINALNQKLQ